MSKDRLMPCQANPDFTCPLNCPNRQKLLVLVEPVLKILKDADVDIGDEAHQYAELAATLRDVIQQSGGVPPEIEEGCINFQSPKKPLIQ